MELNGAKKPNLHVNPGMRSYWSTPAKCRNRTGDSEPRPGEVGSVRLSVKHWIAFSLFLWIAFSGMAETHDAWNIRNSALTNRLNGVVYGDGLFVAVGSETTILTSPNGRDWTVQPAGTTSPTIWSAAFGDSRYVLGGGEGALIRSSTNGLHWTDGLSTIGAENIHAVTYGYAFGKGLFVAVGKGAHANTSYVLTSSNGLDWIPRSVPTTNTLFGVSPAFGANGVGWAEDLFIAVGDHGTIITSTNGIDWLRRNSDTTVALRTVLFHQGKMMALGDSGIVLFSSDGISWSNSAPTSFNIRGAASSWDAIVAVGNYQTDGRLHVSTDGLAWPGSSIEFPQRLNAITYGGDSFVGVGDGGLIVQSDTKNFWTNPTSGDWHELDHWSLGALPGRMQSVAIVNSGWKAVSINAATVASFPASLTMNDLTVACFAGGSNTLLLNFIGTTVPLRISNGMNIGPGGTVLNYSSGVTVENGPLGITSGQFFQDGGLVRATNGMTYLDGGGVYQLTNGLYEADIVQLGIEGDGNFNQYGGIARMNSLTLGNYAPAISGDGAYALYGGNLSVRGTLHLGGFYARGTFFQFGGTNSASLLELSPRWSGQPTYQLNGGVLRTDFTSVTATDFVSTRFEQNGGSHIVTNILALHGSTSHGSSGHDAKYFLNGGMLSAKFIELDGRSGYVIFAQTNGTTSVTDTLFLNQEPSPYTGTVFLEGGTFACANVSSGGAGDDIVQTGGSLIVTNLFSFGGHSFYGYPRFAKYAFNGGTLMASNIELSAEWSIGSSDQAGRVLNPGCFKLSGTLDIGDATEQLGRFILASNATIKMSGSYGRLSFADSSTENWNMSSLLIVSNWNGLPGGGGGERLKFGTNQFGLTLEQLGRIQFRAGYPPDLYSARVLNTGEVVPGEVLPPSILLIAPGNNVVLSWPPGWVLQTAVDVAGPYADVLNATSPFTNDMTEAVQRFFRLRQF